MADQQIEIAGLPRVSADSSTARKLGAVLGMAVGDALGTTYEFQRLEQAPYPTLATGPATDVVGKGPFKLVAGQITDDTQMAICIARSLAAPRSTPHLDAADLAQRYLAWFRHAFDVGSQTATALGEIDSGTPVLEAGRRVWQFSGRRMAGNGSLMRTAPIGMYFADAGIDAVLENALTDSLMTHADPRCALAAAVFDAAIAQAVTSGAAGESADRASAMFAAAHTHLPRAAAKLRELWADDRDDIAALDHAVVELGSDLDAAASPDPGVYGDLHVHRTAGFVRVAFRLAFWHLAHTTSWRDAVVDVASRGGDADTNAAIVGALLGARDGVAAIPRPWLERVLAVTQPGPPTWAEAHHPRHLVELVRLSDDAMRS